MSDARAKAERSKAKDARQMPAPEKIRPQKSKKKKPFVVKYRWINPPFNFDWMLNWSNMGKYRSVADAEKAMATQEKKHPGRYEMKLPT